MAASAAVAFGSGSITTAISGKQSQIHDLDSQIADWDDRLASREALLKTQYANLETALGSSRTRAPGWPTAGRPPDLRVVNPETERGTHG